MVMLAVVLVGNLLRPGGKVFANTLFLRACVCAAPMGFVAVLAGWTTTEVGRQPWTIYGLLRTAQSVSPSLTGSDVLLSLLGYMITYLIMFPAGVVLMARVVRRGVDADVEIDPVEAGRSTAPVLAISSAAELKSRT
jgi:cytochrome bd ubiquinol oxidase subunit I